MRRLTHERAFTLIELLVVISIIGLLASIVLVALRGARDKASVARTQETLSSIRTAITRMALDTDKWPNGCVPGTYQNGSYGSNEVDINDQESGLFQKPAVQSIAPPSCEWTASDVARWAGPYITGSALKDIWGNDFWVDSDYHPRQDCPTAGANPSAPVIGAVVSGGPNGLSGARGTGYDCDDVYLKLIETDSYTLPY